MWKHRIQKLGDYGDSQSWWSFSLPCLEQSLIHSKYWIYIHIRSWPGSSTHKPVSSFHIVVLLLSLQVYWAQSMTWSKVHWNYDLIIFKKLIQNTLSYWKKWVKLFLSVIWLIKRIQCLLLSKEYNANTVKLMHQIHSCLTEAVISFKRYFVRMDHYIFF